MYGYDKEIRRYTQDSSELCDFDIRVLMKSFHRKLCFLLGSGKLLNHNEMGEKSEPSCLLIDLKDSDAIKGEEFFPNVYYELKKRACYKLNREYENIPLTKTGLVHETYLRMLSQNTIEAEDKAHLMAIADRCMRQILIDKSRKRKALKRGGEQKDVAYRDDIATESEEQGEALNLDKKLRELEKIDKRMAKVVKLRFFERKTVHSVSETLGVSERTVKRDWAKSRGWLHKELENKF